MDNLQEFLARQRAVAEMSDEDIDEYEARVRRGDRRRNLWKSNETAANSLQSAREDAYFTRSAGSLSPRDSSSDGSYDYAVEKKSRPSNSRKEDAACGESSSIMPGSSDTHEASASTMNNAPASRSNRVHSAEREASDSACEYLRDAALPRHSQAPLLHSPGPVTPLTDTAYEGRGSTDVKSNQVLKDHDSCLMTSMPQLSDVTKSSKNHKGSLREQVLKKSNFPGNDKQNVSTDSNLTSPSTSPLVSSSTSSNLTGPHRARRTLESERKARRAEKARKEAEAASRKKEEAREKLMTPTEYAIKVQSKFAATLEKTPPEQLFLRDKVIFYVGGDHSYAVASTRKKMDILRQKGATVVPTYDPNTVTHIVTSADRKTTSKALGLESIEEIPMHIPTVTWEWVLSGNKGALDYEFMHAAFPSRIHADSSKATAHQNGKGKGKLLAAPRPINLAEEEFSRIEDFTLAELTTPHDAATSDTKENSRSKIQLSSHDSASPASSSAGPPADDDPLAEFYAQAKKDRDAEWMQEFEKGSEDESQSPMPIIQEPGFTCDQKHVNVGACINQDIVDKLSELRDLHKSKVGSEEHWRVFSYGKSIRAIRAYPKRIRSYEEAVAIKGVGEKTALKIKEIIETGDLRRIEHDNTEDVRAINMFNNIYGVGPNTAYKWYASGCRTLEDIKRRKGEITLSPVQELGLKFYDDINTRIPRIEVTDIFNMIKAIALEIDPKLFIEIMGSYRRGEKTCGDVDILMTRPTDDGRTHRGVLRRLLKELHLRGILTEDLAMPDDLDDLEATYRGLCRRDQSSRRRRIDILVVKYESRGAALIYYTGDDIFNRAIRFKAGKMGYSLSQRGLYKNVLRDSNNKRRKISKGIIIASETEEEIFRILGVPWQAPHERVRA